MASKKGKALTITLGCIVLLLLGSVVLCCGGGALLVIAGPGVLLSFVVSDEPLPVQTVKWDDSAVEALEDRIGQDILDDRTVSLTGEELTQLMLSDEDVDDLPAFRIAVDDQDRGVFDLSVQLDPAQPQYLNIHAVGDFTVEDGWFTYLVIDEMEIGKFDLGQYIVGQDLHADANNSLAQQRVNDPEAAEAIDMIEYLAVEDGHFTLTFTEEAMTKLAEEGKL